MAKLRKLTIEVHLEDTRERYHYETQMEYSPRDELFFIRMPEDQKQFEPEDKETRKMVSSMKIRGHIYDGVKAFSATTEIVVIEKAMQYFRAFLTAVRAHRKVILYKFLYRTKDISEDRGRIGSRMDRMQILEFGFVVGEENIVGSKKTYLRRWMDESPFEDQEREMTEDLTGLTDKFSDNWDIMDWTPEREQFFENLKAGMHQMIEQVDGFVSDNESFAALIDQGKNLLSTGKENS